MWGPKIKAIIFIVLISTIATAQRAMFDNVKPLRKAAVLKDCVGRTCSTDRDCLSAFGECRGGCCTQSIRPFFSLLLQQNPCPATFKSRCKTDEDCPCDQEPLRCEDNECVKNRRLPNRARSFYWDQNDHDF